MSYFLSPPIPPFTISTKNYIFGSSNSFKKTCSDLNLEILGEIPMEPKVSERGDKGWPIVLGDGNENEGDRDGGGGAREAFLRLGRDIWKRIE